MAGNRTIRVFIASPSDLAVERRAFKEVIDELNKGYGRGAHVIFEPLGWEDALSQVGRRPQDLINKDIDVCDVFVLVMWRRWGQRAPDAKARGFTSYTEEEFYRALKRFEKKKSPTICAFFKHIETGEMASPGADLKKVLRFRRKLEASKQVLWRGFKDEIDFRKDIDKHLTAFANGDMEPAIDPPGEPILPDSALAEMKKLRQQAQAAEKRAEAAVKRVKEANRKVRNAEKRAQIAEQLAEAKAATKSLTLAESAATAALEGRIEEARQEFAKALDGTTNLRVLHLGFGFFKRIGELDEAERILRRWLSISGPDQQTVDTANAYGNLGMIERIRGNLNAAEAFQMIALAIFERLESSEGIASTCCSIGIIESIRGNLDAAEASLKRALANYVKLGREEGTATIYGNLASIEQMRGNLDKAEEYLRTSLAIEERLGRQEGTASDYGSLGLIEHRRGNLDAAESMFNKALEIDEKLGRVESVATAYANLGLVELSRGNFDSAEAYCEKSLEINSKAGNQGGVAANLANIGSIHESRGDSTSARDFWTRARNIYALMGVKQKVDELQDFINCSDR